MHCMERGGYVRGQGVDYDMATCEAFELGRAAEILRRIIASADNELSLGRSDIAAIDARLISEARELVK